MQKRFNGLWRDANFMKLWVGQTISLLGSQITPLALPLTAVLILHASPFQLGLLGAAQFAPFLLVSLFAGVWVDRLRRRPILIFSNFASALLLGSIPLVALLQVLQIEYLYLVGFLTGISTVFFQVAYQTYLPFLVGRDYIVEGNSKLEISNSIAALAGPGLAGGLVQLITAPFAILFDAISFLVAAVTLIFIRKPEPPIEQIEARRSIWKDISYGMRLLLTNPLLRSIAGCTGTANFFGSMTRALFVAYAVQTLSIEPALLGIILAVGSGGPLLGVLLLKPVTQRFGLGATIVGAKLVGDLGGLLTPLAGGPLPLAAFMLIVAQFVGGLSGPLYSVNAISLRQALIPTNLQGRVNASNRFIVWGTIPLGSFIGGILGQLLGLRLTITIAALGIVTSFLWVYFSPVVKLKEQP